MEFCDKEVETLVRNGLDFPQLFVFSHCLNMIFPAQFHCQNIKLILSVVTKNHIHRYLILLFRCIIYRRISAVTAFLPPPKKKSKRVKNEVLVPKHCMNDWLNGKKQSKMIWMHTNTYFSTMSNAQPSVYCPLLSRGNNNDDEQLLLLQMETNDISHQQTAQPFRLSMSP